MSTQSISYKRHRFPPAIITYAFWLHCRFNLSFHEIEGMFLERGINVSYESIQRRIVKLGPFIVRGLRRRQPRSCDIWHLDEVVAKIKDRKYWLSRDVDQNGVVLDEILQRRRDEKAARRLLYRLMKRQRRHQSASSPTSCDPTAWPSVKLFQASNIDPTKISTIERRTATCHSESGKGQYRNIAHREVCSGLY
ncbi:MAG: DDE-type integrase/transposase/recombinase [Paracoccaceae bacterium]|nr:DDE-type integrase/transposase/recombinase [Paracoccaceae bacterium]